MKENELEQFDSAIIQFIQGQISDQLTSIMKVLTFFGSIPWFIMAAIAVSIFLVLSHKKRYAVFLLFTSWTGLVLNLVLKWMFKRERPDLLPIIAENGFSFPSGHSMGSFVFYGALAVILVRISKHAFLDWIFGSLCALIILFIGISRIYLGVHYPSDVIGGFAAGGAWLTICGLGLRYFEYSFTKKRRGDRR
ncbi:phosphatase PAP2 family protein [Bacillus sp. V59.32b]|uniref:phosphatase PAP2 family protein n=1 Tax=Bacillus sp. V59.32b TaxID=1758642 RepID=UPI0020B11310|nr:phosphatase PAP2 family protein [Bacillus sp. V59.32b]